MRVIAGSARHLKLIAPTGNDTRPTADSIRETLFNMLRNDIPGAVFLDLFAGSGAVGIEALSRGAARAYFVENKPAALKCLIRNLETTGLSDKAVVLKSDAVQSLRRIREDAVDLIYMDPPYDAALYAPVLECLSGMPMVQAYTTIIAESRTEQDFSFVRRFGFDVIREKRYKSNKHVFMKRTVQEDRHEDSDLSGEL